MVSWLLSACLLFSTVLLGEIRAAIDIGMGGPKLQIAEVDVQTHKIVKTLHFQSYFVNFYEGISKGDDRRLSSEVMEKGFKSCTDAIAVARSFGAGRIVAVATASLRSASNGAEFAQTIEQGTGIAVHIVDPCLEGKLAFAGVQSRLDAKDLVVLDIGGGAFSLLELG